MFTILNTAINPLVPINMMNSPEVEANMMQLRNRVLDPEWQSSFMDVVMRTFSVKEVIDCSYQSDDQVVTYRGGVTVEQGNDVDEYDRSEIKIIEKYSSDNRRDKRYQQYTTYELKIKLNKTEMRNIYSVFIANEIVRLTTRYITQQCTNIESEGLFDYLLNNRRDTIQDLLGYIDDALSVLISCWLIDYETGNYMLNNNLIQLKSLIRDMNPMYTRMINMNNERNFNQNVKNYISELYKLTTMISVDMREKLRTENPRFFTFEDKYE